MALVTRLDNAYTDGDELVDDGADGLDTLLQAAGWTQLDEIDATVGQQDRVYYSSGEDGNQELYLRVTHDSTVRRIHFRAYSLWDDATHVGYNGIGDTSGNTCLLYPAGGFDAWAILTADHVALVADYDGGTTYNKFYGGLVETLVAAQHRFNGHLGPPVTNYNSNGDDKLRMASGTSYANLEADQYLWIVSQSASSGPSTTEKVQVSAYDALTETVFLVDPLTEDHSNGSVVALDPQEVVLWGDTTGQLSTATVYALHSTDNYESTSLSWTSILDSVGLTTIPATDYAEYPLAELFLYDSAAGQRNAFGNISRFRRAPSGSAAAEDTFTVDADTLVNFPDGGGYFSLQVT